MADFFFNLSKEDDYYTTLETWRLIVDYVPKHLRVYEPFFAPRSRSKEYLNELGYAHVLYEDRDFFDDPPDPASYDVIVTNPPFSQKLRVMKKLRELGKPFVVTLPSTVVGANCLRPFEGLQLMVPYRRLRFERPHPVTGRTETLRNACFTSVFVCWRVGLPSDLVWLPPPPKTPEEAAAEAAAEAKTATAEARRAERGAKREREEAAERAWFDARYGVVRAAGKRRRRALYDLEAGAPLKRAEFAARCAAADKRAAGAAWLADERARTYDGLYEFHPRSATWALYLRPGAPLDPSRLPESYRGRAEADFDDPAAPYARDPADERAVVERATGRRLLAVRRCEWRAVPGEEEEPEGGGDPDESLLETWYGVVRDGVCGGDAARFEYALDWLAHAAQFPDRKPRTTLVLCGPGAWHTKRVFTDWAERAFGERAVRLEPGAGDGAAALGKVLSVASDVSFRAERKSLARRLRRDEFAVRRGGLSTAAGEPVTVRNVMRAVVATAESPSPSETGAEFVAIPADDRLERALPWARLEADLRRGGARALLYSLARRNLDRFIY